MRNKILLIQSPTVHYYRERFALNNSLPPLGMLYLQTILQKQGYDVTFVDLLVEAFTEEEFVKLLAREKPGMVGISVFTESFRYAKVLAKLAKETLPDCIVIYGGPFPSFVYEESLQDKHVDYVVRFEGEETIKDLLRALEKNPAYPVTGVLGTAYRNNGKIVAEPRRPSNKNLDSLPIPNRDSVNGHLYTWPFSIITARGCPADCTYCAAGAFWDGVRLRSVGNLAEELQYLKTRYDMTGFYIADDTFTCQRKRVVEFCNWIQKNGVNLNWACESRVTTVDENLLRLMYDSGCRRIQFGVESGVQSILDSVRKGITVEQIDNAISAAHKAGLFIIISFIFGHPRDTLDSMRRTFEFVTELQRKYHVYVMAAINTPFPGTYQFDHADELGLKIHSDNWDDYILSHPIISTDNFTLDDLRRIHTEFACSDICRINAGLITGAFDKRYWAPDYSDENEGDWFPSKGIDAKMKEDAHNE